MASTVKKWEKAWNMGHKGKHSAVSLSKRFQYKPLKEPHTVCISTLYISLPCWVTFPNTTFDVLQKSKVQFVITARPRIMQTPVDCFNPTNFFLWFSLIVSILVTSYKCSRADVVRLHKLEHKSVKLLRPQLCWGWSSQDRMATKGPLLRPRSMSLYCLQKP